MNVNKYWMDIYNKEMVDVNAFKITVVQVQFSLDNVALICSPYIPTIIRFPDTFFIPLPVKKNLYSKSINLKY